MAHWVFTVDRLNMNEWMNEYKNKNERKEQYSY